MKTEQTTSLLRYLSTSLPFLLLIGWISSDCIATNSSIPKEPWEIHEPPPSISIPHPPSLLSLFSKIGLLSSSIFLLLSKGLPALYCCIYKEQIIKEQIINNKKKQLNDLKVMIQSYNGLLFDQNSSINTFYSEIEKSIEEFEKLIKTNKSNNLKEKINNYKELKYSLLKEWSTINNLIQEDLKMDQNKINKIKEQVELIFKDPPNQKFNEIIKNLCALSSPLQINSTLLG